jgi:lipoate-protein ligase A
MKRTRKGLLLQGTIFADNSWNLDSELFYNSLVVFFAEMLGEKEERVVWIESFEEEQKKISKQFTELSWKKSRKRN